jgi:hypothetical protein
MAAILLVKCHSLGLQTQSDAAREVLPTRVTRGFISNSRGRKDGSISTLFKQHVTKEQQLTMVFVRHTQLASLQKKNELVVII